MTQCLQSRPDCLWKIVARERPPKLHLLSGVELQREPYELPADLRCDILVAAGNIGPLEVSIPWLASQGMPVVYVLGEIERGSCEDEEPLRRARRLAAGTNVHVLEHDSIELMGVRFLGATDWASDPTPREHARRPRPTQPRSAVALHEAE